MMSGICFKKFQEGRKEEKKEERKERVLGGDSETRLAKCRHILAA